MTAPVRRAALHSGEAVMATTRSIVDKRANRRTPVAGRGPRSSHIALWPRLSLVATVTITLSVLSLIH